MALKKIISVSFVTLSIVNTGTPMVVNATTDLSGESIEDERLNYVFDSPIDFNTLKVMNESKIDNKEEEKQEETKDELVEKETSHEEVIVDKEVEETSEESDSNKDVDIETKKESEEATITSTDEHTEDSDVKLTFSGEQETGKWGTMEWVGQLQDDGVYSYRFEGGTSGSVNSAPWKGRNHDAFKVEFTGEVVIDNSQPSSTEGLFQNENLVDFKSNEVTCVGKMNRMFFGCEKLKKLDVSGWDTTNVTSMDEMFRACENLEALDVSGWNTTNVNGMASMFRECKNLEELDVSGWDITNVTYMTTMFEGCENLEELDVSGWDTTNVNGMNRMFLGCRNLKALDVSGWDTTNVISMGEMFRGCENLEALDVSGWNTTNVISMYSMFLGCRNLKELDLSGWNTTKVVSMTSMFSNCTNLKELNLSRWKLPVNLIYGYSNMMIGTKLETLKMNEIVVPNEAGFTLIRDGFFKGLSNEPKVELKGWDVTAFTALTDLTAKVFSPLADVNVKELDLSDWKTSNVEVINDLLGSNSAFEIVNLSNWDMSKVKNMSKVFEWNSNLRNLDLSGWDTTNVTNMYRMFTFCENLEALDVSDWNTTNVTSMAEMFKGCENLEALDLSGWNTINVTIMGEMFYGCENLEALDLSGWDTTNVTNMSSMFRECENLEALDLSGWNTTNVTSMGNMFYRCKNLKELDLSGWDTTNLVNMYRMFTFCENLEALDLSGWDTTKVFEMSYMFDGCTNLKELNLSRWKLPVEAKYSGMTAGTKLETLKMNEIVVPNEAGFTLIRDELFKGLSNEPKVELKGWDVTAFTRLTDLTAKVFSPLADVNVKELDLSDWKTSNVTSMSQLFAGADKLESINLSNWNTAGVNNIEEMFSGGKSLKAIDLSGWKIEKTVAMNKMFEEVKKLERLTLGDEMRFNTTAELSNPASPKQGYVCGWTREDGLSGVYKPEEFMENFGTGDLTGGTYVASEVAVPYTLSNFKSDTVTIGEVSTTSFDIDLADELEEGLFTNGKMSLSVAGKTLPEEIDYENIEVGYINAAGSLIEIEAKRYDKENDILHFDIEKSFLNFTKKIRINLTGTAWNNTTDATDNTVFLVDFNTDETKPTMDGYWVKTIGGQTQINNGLLGFSSVPKMLAFKPTKLVVTNKEILVDRVLSDWGIQISDYRGTNALSPTDESVARKDWELVATMDKFHDSKGKDIAPSALGLVYINEDGQREDLSENEEVVVEKHEVEKETPKENSMTNVSWKEDTGIKTVVKNRNALNSNEEYSASVNYELRVAP